MLVVFFVGRGEAKCLDKKKKKNSKKTAKDERMFDWQAENANSERERENESRKLKWNWNESDWFKIKRTEEKEEGE